MSELILRTATSADLIELENFEQGVITAERPFDSTLKPDGVRYYDLAALVSSPDAHFLIAEMASRPVGCGFARLDAAKAYLRHARHGYLGLMYVVPEYRGRGINGRILQALSGWCRERGVCELRLDVYSRNEPAVRAYLKAGFEPHMLEMRLGLNP